MIRWNNNFHDLLEFQRLPFSFALAVIFASIAFMMFLIALEAQGPMETEVSCRDYFNENAFVI